MIVPTVPVVSLIPDPAEYSKAFCLSERSEEHELFSCHFYDQYTRLTKEEVKNCTCCQGRKCHPHSSIGGKNFKLILDDGLPWNILLRQKLLPYRKTAVDVMPLPGQRTGSDRYVYT